MTGRACSKASIRIAVAAGGVALLTLAALMAARRRATSRPKVASQAKPPPKPMREGSSPFIDGGPPRLVCELDDYDPRSQRW
jgi:hypothetical protein